MHEFLFATGIENSYPVITDRDGANLRVDEMEKCGHYARWREDFALVQQLGIECLRYGPPYYRVHQGPSRYDWGFVDETFGELQRLAITPIVDLCHFGLPDWVTGSFQNSEWPEYFAEYVGAFAARYPWVRFYTPVNEIYICATFSAMLVWWNERLQGDRPFVTALKNLVRANLLAEEAILQVRPDALFVQSESSEYFHLGSPSARAAADFYNEKLFLSLDLCYGHDVSARMYRYLTDNGMSPQEYDWFMARGRAVKRYCIMGNDYYVTNEHLVRDDGSIVPSGEIFGYYLITKRYFDRYHLPVMHTETNLADAARAPDWLWKEWANMVRLKQDGVPIIGFTWYSLTDQIDWDTALREDNGNVNPLGLFDLDRKVRPVGDAYKRLIAQWKDILPADSLCLSVQNVSSPRSRAETAAMREEVGLNQGVTPRSQTKPGEDL